jgi:hypothetical protein
MSHEEHSGTTTCLFGCKLKLRWENQANLSSLDPARAFFHLLNCYKYMDDPLRQNAMQIVRSWVINATTLVLILGAQATWAVVSQNFL